MTKNEFLILTDKYNRGECTPGEEKLIIQFCQDVQVADITLQWDLSEEEETKIKLLKRINSQIDTQQSEGETKGKEGSRFALWKVAASLALFIGIGYGTFHFYNPEPQVTYVTKETERGQQLKITLGDGSVVQLNAESSIQFPEEFSSAERKVLLEGEAFFNVAKDADKPFIIKTQGLSTEVLGTSFNIQAYPEDGNIKVTVATGKVKVRRSSESDNSSETTLGNHEEVFLLPEYQAVFHKETGSIAKRQVSLSSYLGWKDGLIVLENVTIAEAVKKLSRLYHVEFEFENDLHGNCVINGEFRRDELTNILENLSFITALKFERVTDKKIKITGKECN
ncbi:DUF4974 domain-containing protein [Fulvivirga sp. M361]|uniref:FecR family protein n=1 Tax=Fulvivirga sp. M361 TaxID=2594266 RepID=UPI00117B9D13|nr:FecR family protein [Fulvivirga sp. M361]TRX60617.1 DUF4974 domain-containing protein [Fulvivirga sp. M361]